jgi:hypothetical protein
VASPTKAKSAVALYAAIAAALVGGIGVGFATVMLATPQEVRAKTPLEVRVDSAREIRQILARPIPRPEPLPAISTKVNGPVAKVADAKVEPPKRSRPRVRRQAREAFASMDFGPRPFFGFMAFGPGRR